MPAERRLRKDEYLRPSTFLKLVATPKATHLSHLPERLEIFIIGVLIEKLVIIGEVLSESEGGALSVRSIYIAKGTI